MSILFQYYGITLVGPFRGADASLILWKGIHFGT